MFGHILWGGICVSIGMLLGMVIGMSISKKWRW
jgi:membrane protein DedA with SNARE-associated domain